MSRVYIVQRKEGGHIYTVYTHYEDAKQFKKGLDRLDEMIIVPKHVIENYREDEEDLEEF